MRAPGALSLASYEPSATLLQQRRVAEDRLVARVQELGDDLPLWAMRGTGESEIRRWLRDELHGLVLARLVPGSLADAPETRRYLALRREAVRYASLQLVPVPG